jgi:predicted permease
MLRDLKYALRSLLRDKGFSATVFLTLAVCIAANTTTFAVVDSVLLRPLPVPDSQSILLMSNRYPKAGVPDTGNSASGDYFDRLRDVPAFQQQALFTTTMRTMDVNGSAEQVHGMVATPSLFPLLGVAPAVGRTFTTEEGEIGKNDKVVLSNALWRRLYGGDSHAIGRQLRLGGRVYDIIGVMPGNFVFVDPDVRYWLPAAFSPEEKVLHHSNNWTNIGRLKPGSTIRQVQSQIDALNTTNLDRFPQFKQLLINAGFHTVVEPLQHTLVKDVEGALYLLWGAAVFVLLLGALNIANLVLARITVRRKEMAIRLALGISRARLARQIILESLAMAAAGGLAGVFLGSALLRVLVASGLDHFPRASEVRIDSTVVLVAFGLALGAGLLTGLLPLAGIFSENLSGSLQDGSRSGTAGTHTRNLRQVLVVAEIGFAFVLIMGAGLLLTSFRNLLAVDPGFNVNGVLTASISAPRAKYTSDSDLANLLNRTLETIRHVPGVAAAGATTSIPFGGDYSDSVIIPEGYRMKPGESVISPHQLDITPGYLAAMSIALVRGRNFDERDKIAAPLTVLIDETLARRYWPDRNPIGQKMLRPDSPDDLVNPGPKARHYEIVGVVRPVRLENLDGSGNQVGAYYFPLAQQPSRSVTLAIRTNTEPRAVLAALRAEIARIDPEIPVFDAKTMNEREELSMASRRTSMTLALAFSILALFLSAIGIYGVLAYVVTQRRREIGIRIALGSTGGGIVRLVLREGLLLVAVGMVLGIGGIIALQKAVANEIYGVRPLDPLVMAMVALILGAIALVACALPARRASRVDPVTVLSE